MEFTAVLVPQEEGGYTIQCLELPGAISQGETKEDALKNIREAIELILEGMQEDIKREKHEVMKVRVGA